MVVSIKESMVKQSVNNPNLMESRLKHGLLNINTSD